MAQTYLKIEQEDGSFLEFKKDRIKARYVKEVFKLQKELSKLGKKEDFEAALDLRIKFVVGLFNSEKLTVDTIYDGIDSDMIVSELDRITNDIVGKSEGEVPGK